MSGNCCGCGRGRTGTAGWRLGTWEELPEESRGWNKGRKTGGTAGSQTGKIKINKVNETSSRIKS